MSNQRNKTLTFALLLVAAFSFRAGIARFLPNDDPFDGKVYAQIARNVLEQHVYSHASEPPYGPSLIRLPGYPLFLAGIYALFGHSDNTAVRVIQALIDTAACALIALLAYYWEPDEKRKRNAAIAALALAAACPFTTIYTATILTETATIFLAVAMCLTATLAFKASTIRQAVLLWAATGLIAGIAVQFRPDSGLFAAAIGITLVVSMLFRPSVAVESKERWLTLWRRVYKPAYLGAIFSIAFCLVLMPWTIRNWRVFHLFQPLAPAHAEMPGEFVPRGYFGWLRTWVDDERYIAPVLWSLDEAPVKLEEIPDRAFDSVEEKARVGALLESYNHGPQQAAAQPSPQPSPENSAGTDEEDQAQPNEDQAQSNTAPEANPSEEESDQTNEEDRDDEGDETDSGVQSAQAGEQNLAQMTPEIDAGFAQIARERIARAPFRYYLQLPWKRGLSLWFNTHSQYYPFEGELLPLEDLDYQIHQQFWLPLFAGLTFIYTVLGVAGGWFLWRSRDFAARRWLLLAVLMIFLRLGFFSSVENPEPRYVVEIFPFLSILGGIAWVQLIDVSGSGKRISTP
jgi:hypothetical protein